MLDFFSRLFASDFMPHKMCYLEDSGVLWLNVLSDSLIALAYFLIPFLLFYFVRKRRDVSFHWILIAFGIFILACGSTHILGAVTVWNPVYRLEGVVKAITGIASFTTLVMMGNMMPAWLRIPSPAQLASEIEERRAAEARILRLNAELDERVASRTAQLVQSESRYRALAEEQELAASTLARILDDLQREMKHRQELEGQLVQSQKMEAVGRLAGGVAHDFNNLLTVILGYNEMLREHIKEDPTALDYAEEVQQAGERASALTDQLLAFSRRQVSAPRVLNLNEVVRQIDKMLRRIIGEDIELQTRLPAGLSRVKADPSHIDQVIMNLAVNSRDAMPNGGKLTIETEDVLLTEDAGRHLGIPAGPYVMLAVSDTGAGMDTLTKSQIFEPFFTTKEKGKGTGLGLAIVYGIVKQSGGEILVYSEPGQGTAFKIYFPVAMEPEEENRIASLEPAPVAGTETILLVEDEEQVRNLTRSILGRHGYRILDAGSASEALALVRETTAPVDLLLTDIVMPQMNGLELATEIRAVRPGIKVLFMSAYTDNAVVNQGILTAQMPFIQKPFTAAALNKKVREVLGG